MTIKKRFTSHNFVKPSQRVISSPERRSFLGLLRDGSLLALAAHPSQVFAEAKKAHLTSLNAPNAVRAKNILEKMQVRFWPSPEYTRLTIESPESVSADLFFLQKPLRLVMDINGLANEKTVQAFPNTIIEGDRFVTRIRTGWYQDKARIVFDLKRMVLPQMFHLKPFAKHEQRLVLDLYPFVEKDGEPEQPKLTKEAPKEEVISPIEPKSVAKKPSKARQLTVMLDPGHGGEDPGAIGGRGTREKDIVLQITKRLKRLLERRGFKVRLTRSSDYYVSLGKRVQKAVGYKADCFISIHADAFRDRRARGASVFVLSERGASSAAARWLANKENSADLVGGVDDKNEAAQIANVLADLTTSAQIKSSLVMGNQLLNNLKAFTRVHGKHVGQAAFAVLKSPSIPSALVETAFISNPYEERLLLSTSHQKKIAEALASGIASFTKKHVET